MVIRRYSIFIPCLLGLTVLGCGGSKGGVTVEPPIPILVQVVPDPMLPSTGSNPTVYQMNAGSTAQFHAVTPQGTRVDSEVTWLAVNRQFGEAGTITQQGFYTAPTVAVNIEIGATVKAGVPQTYMGTAFVTIVVPKPTEPVTN